MDGDQQLNFYYMDPVATLDRFIGQPKFAGKTYMKFELQESEERPAKRAFGRANAGRVFQEAQLIDMHSVPMLHLFYGDKSHSGGQRSTYPVYRENCNISAKICINCINIIFVIYCILSMILQLSTALLQRAA